MIKIVVCDDQVIEQNKVIQYLKAFSETITPIEVKVFSSPLELMSTINAIAWADIFLLDIIMPGFSGIALGKHIRENRKDAVIIYFTSSTDYALDAYGIQALQYLLKPVVKSSLFQALKKAIVLVKKHEHYYTIQTRSELIPVKTNDIKYIEYKNHFLCFHVKDTLITSKFYREPFAKVLEKLFEQPGFIQTHRAFVINMHHVDKMNTHAFMMNDQARIPISKSRLTQVRKSYVDFLINV